MVFAIEGVYQILKLVYDQLKFENQKRLWKQNVLQSGLSPENMKQELACCILKHYKKDINKKDNLGLNDLLISLFFQLLNTDGPFYYLQQGFNLSEGILCEPGAKKFFKTMLEHGRFEIVLVGMEFLNSKDVALQLRQQWKRIFVKSLMQHCAKGNLNNALKIRFKNLLEEHFGEETFDNSQQIA